MEILIERFKTPDGEFCIEGEAYPLGPSEIQPGGKAEAIITAVWVYLPDGELEPATLPTIYTEVVLEIIAEKLDRFE